MRADGPRSCSGDLGSRNPITGIAGCCARAASGHAAAAPPSSVMNSRRSHSITSSARASSVGGTSRPSAFAVLRLMTSSKLGGLLDRQIGRLLALEDLVDVGGRTPIHLTGVRPVIGRALDLGVFAPPVDRGQPV